MADDFVIPDEIEESVGWRGWKVTENGLLQAIVHDEAIWQPGVPTQAVCYKGKRHPVPFMNCTCGFYATKTLTALQENGYHLDGAFGTVSYWGKMIDFTDGFRAQFAYPREIWVPYSKLHWVQALSIYGVPVRLANPYTVNERELAHGNREAHS
jgi:hypothetical protein